MFYWFEHFGMRVGLRRGEGLVYVDVALVFWVTLIMQKKVKIRSEAMAAILVSWPIKAIAKWAEPFFHSLSEHEEESCLYLGDEHVKSLLVS